MLELLLRHARHERVRVSVPQPFGVPLDAPELAAESTVRRDPVCHYHDVHVEHRGERYGVLLHTHPGEDMPRATVLRCPYLTEAGR